MYQNKPATRLSLASIAEQVSALIGAEVQVDRDGLGLLASVAGEGIYWMEMTVQYWEGVERPTSIGGWAESLADSWDEGEWALIEGCSDEEE